MPGISCLIGSDKHDRDFLGRWSIGRVGSNAYLFLTSRQITERIQRVLQSLCGEGFAYDENELLDNLREFAAKSDLSGQRIRRRHKMLPLFKAEDTTRHGDEEESEDENPQHQADGEQLPPDDPDEGVTYFVTILRRTGFRRLRASNPSLAPNLMPFVGFAIFFPPTPPRLSPGRYTSFNLPEIELICMQSHQ